MYDDSWYSFVPEVAKTAASTVKNAGHRRKESLLQQPNVCLSPLAHLTTTLPVLNSPPRERYSPLKLQSR